MGLFEVGHRIGWVLEERDVYQDKIQNVELEYAHEGQEVHQEEEDRIPQEEEDRISPEEEDHIPQEEVDYIPQEEVDYIPQMEKSHIVHEVHNLQLWQD